MIAVSYLKLIVRLFTFSVLFATEMEFPSQRQLSSPHVYSRASSESSIQTVQQNAPPRAGRRDCDLGCNSTVLAGAAVHTSPTCSTPSRVEWSSVISSRVLNNAASLGTDATFLGGDCSYLGDGDDDYDEPDMMRRQESRDSLDRSPGDEEEARPALPPREADILFAGEQRNPLEMVYSTSRAPSTHKRLGTWPVYLASVETMWGVILFIKFSWCVGTVGLIPSLGAVLLSAACQMLSASSLCAVATNGLVTRSGGAYVMLVKSLGVGPGGAVGIMYYLGMTSLVAVELWGSVDIAESLIKHHYGEGFLGSGQYWDRVLLCLLGFVLLAILRISTNHAARHLMALSALFIFFLALAACIGGIFIGQASSWKPEAITPDLPSPSLKYLRENLLLSEDVSFNQFARVLVFIYPCFIGIFQGSNLCNSIDRPFLSIPVASFASVLTSLVLYCFLLTVMALMAPAHLLVTHQELFLEYAYPTYYIGYIGAMAVGMCSSLSCLESAPSLLKGVADDRVLRILNPLDLGRVSSWNHEPNRAILFTVLIALPFSFVPEIDTIASVTAVCFLATYLAMNFCCFLQSTLSLPGWRPFFRYFSWHTALLGTLSCAFIMFYIEGVISLVAVVVAVMLFIVIEITGDTTTFGSGIRGLKQHIALTALLGVEESIVANAFKSKRKPTFNLTRATSFRDKSHEHDKVTPTSQSSVGELATSTGTATKPYYQQPSMWRPQLLVYLHSAERNGTCTATNRRQLLSFASQLKASRGLTIVASIHLEEASIHAVPEGASLASLMAADYDKKRSIRRTLMHQCERMGVVGFVEVVTAPDYRTGLSALLQLSGLGSLRPNCCVFSWPSSLDAISVDRAERILELLARCTAHERAVISLKLGNQQPFPMCNERLSGTVDVWWLLHDGGILVLISHLLHRHAVWRNCRLRLFTVVEGAENEGRVTADLANYLQAVRIRAEVHVVSFAKADLEAFSTDWTVRRKRTEGVTHRSLSELFIDPTATPAADAPSVIANGPPDLPAMEPAHLNALFASAAVPAVVKAAGGVNGALPTSPDAEFQRQIKIRRAILEHSRNAAMILINLPPPPKAAWSQPLNYFKLVESLTADLPRVVFVYGSGTEVLSQYI